MTTRTSRRAKTTRANRLAAKTTKTPKALLSRNEAATLAGVPLSFVDKAIAQGVIRRRRLRTHRETLVPRESVLALRMLESVQRSGLRMSVKSKKQLTTWVSKQQTAGRQPLPDLEFAPAVVIRPDKEAIDAAERADRYAEARERWIEHNPRIFGGQPVITGTRITVHSVARRLEDGDTIETLREDYPYLPQEAFDVAATYAAAHPRRGRPVKPWRDPAAG